MIFFDMDGTLAKFYSKKDCLERMYERNYFLKLAPYKLIDFVNELIDKNVNVGILSACIKSPFCESEKLAWIEKYIPKLDTEHIILCKTNESKGEIAYEYAKNHCTLTENLILVDDYSKNLYDWEMQGKRFKAIKFCNGINNTSGNEYTYQFRQISQLRKILHSFGELLV